MMMFFVAMIKGIAANQKCQGNHCPFKKHIVNDVNAKQRQTGKEHRQKRTMNGAGHRGGNSNSVPIDPVRHYAKLKKSNSVAKFEPVLSYLCCKLKR